jgi:hypothetical protein
MLTITNVSSPIWADAALTRIICQVKTKERGGPFAFAATAADRERHGQQLWKDLIAGEYGVISAYVAPPAPKAAVPPKSTGTQKL